MLREIGRPKITVGTNGLRVIERRYSVAGKIDRANVLLPYWKDAAPSLDDEFPTACLVKQDFEASEKSGEEILVRTYHELGESKENLDDNQVEIERPKYSRDSNNLLQITRQFIQLRVDAGEWKDNTKIGSEVFEGHPLAKIEAEEGVVFVKVTKSYFEKGIISSKRDLLHNEELTKLTVRTTGLSERSELTPYFDDLDGYHLISETEGSGSVDYQFGGLEVRTWVFVLGEGLISRIEEEMSEGEHIKEVWLTTGDEAPTPGIAEKDIYYEEVDHKAEFTLYKFHGIEGAGIIFRSDDLRFDDHVTQVTIRQINEFPDEIPGFIIIGSKKDTSGRYPVHERTYLKIKEGVIGKVEDLRGSLKVVTETVITRADADEPPSSIENPTYKNHEIKELYAIWTFRTVEGTGEMERRVDEKANGAIKIISVKGTEDIDHGLEDEEADKANLITNRTFSDGPLNLTHKVWVVGDGLVSTSHEYKGDITIISYTQVVSTKATDLNPTLGPDNELLPNIFEVKVLEEDGYVVYSWKRLFGEGAYYDEVSELHDGALTVTTRRHFGDADIPADAFQSGTDTSGSIKVTFYKTVEGEGVLFQKTEGQTDGLIHTTVSYVGDVSDIQPTDSYHLSRSTDAKQGYSITTDMFVHSDTQAVTRKSVERNGATLTEVTRLGQVPTLAGAQVGSRDTKLKLYGGGEVILYRRTFAAGSGEFARTSFVRDGVQKIRIRSLNVAPNLVGCIESAEVFDHKALDGSVAYKEYDYTYISGDGVLSTSVEVRGGLKFTKVRFIGNPDLTIYNNSNVVDEYTEYLKDAQGDVCIAVQSRTYLTGMFGSHSTSYVREGVRYKDYVRYDTACGVGGVQNVIKRDDSPVYNTEGLVVGCVTKFKTAEPAGGANNNLDNNPSVWFVESLKGGGGVPLTRYQTAGVDVPGGVCAVRKSAKDFTDVDGAVLFQQFTFDVVETDGEYERDHVLKDGCRLTTIRSVNVIPPPLADQFATVRTAKEVKDDQGVVCYTLYEYTYLDVDAGATGISRRVDQYHADGSRVITVQSYEKFMDPTPHLDSQGNEIDPISTETLITHRGLEYDSESRPIYTTQMYVAPHNQTLFVTRNHFRYGVIKLNTDAEVEVVSQPQSGPMRLEVSVEYSKVLPADAPVERVASPVVTETLLLHNGATQHSREVYHRYESFDTGSSSDTWVQKFDTLVDALPVRKVYRRLSGHQDTAGVAGLVSIDAEVAAAAGGETIYRITRVTDPA